jgi:hypothetical protein
VIDLDPTTLALGLVFSGIGFVAFRYGRKMELLAPTVIGLLLMLYPMFAPGPVSLGAIGVGLTFGLWLFRE